MLSSPVIESATVESEQPVETMKSTDVETPIIVQPENVKGPSDSNHVIEITTANSIVDDGVTPTNSTFLRVSSAPMGRSSRYINFRYFPLRSSYHEELDEVIDYCATSPDNTETETSDADHKPSNNNNKKKKNRRKSRLPWSTSSDIGFNEAKISSIFSFASAPGDDGVSKSLKKLQRKQKGGRKDGDVDIHAIGIAVSVSGAGQQPTSLISPADSETDPRLSPHPWTHQNNISQSSLKSSDFSRHSHISSNRSSVDNPRSRTPIFDRPPPTTFAAIRHSHLSESFNDDDGDDLPTEVVMPAARAEKPRSSSYSSNQSAASSGKGSKMGTWLRKKRGFSVSSSGGGSTVVSD